MDFKFRLWQRILQHGQVRMEASADDFRFISNCIRNGTVAFIDEAAEVYLTGRKLEWDFAKDFPMCRPPWRNGFYEFIMHGKILTTEGWINIPEPLQVGYAISEMSMHDWKQSYNASQKIDEWRLTENDACCAYMAVLVVACKSGGLIPRVFPVVTQWALDRDGKICALINSYSPYMLYDHNVSTVMFALSLMNCKNVTIKSTPSDTDPVRIKKLARHGIPRITIKTLEIDAFKEVVRTQTEGGESGIKKALHLCRGHFRTYEPETSNGLFGRGQFGTFWVPQHTRGDSKIGVVEKDYKLKVSKPE